MSKLAIAATDDTKVVPLNAKNNLFTLADFFAAYGANTNEGMLQLLTNMFNEYKKTKAINRDKKINYCSFPIVLHWYAPFYY